MVSRKEKILLFFLFAACLSLRIFEITQKNLWFDEVFSWHISLNNFYGIIVRTSFDIHPPLYYFVLKIWMNLFGDSVFNLRLLSALFTSAAIFFIYPVSRRVLSPVNSLIVLILYLLSPLNIHYSQEVRMAAMNLFLNAGAVYFIARLIFDKKITVILPGYKQLLKDKTVWSYILFSSAALYTHYFSFFILAAQLIYIIAVNLRSLKNLKPFAVIYSVIFIIYLPWIRDLIEHISRGQTWRVPQTISSAAGEYVNFLKDLNLGLYYHYTDPVINKYITLSLAFIFITAILIIILKHRQLAPQVKLIILTAAVPLILAGIISIRQKVEFYRYLSILVPYILLTIVYGLSLIKQKYIMYLLVFCIAVVNFYGITIQNSFNFKNDDYRGIIRSIEIKSDGNERIYVEPHYNGWVIDYYRKQENLKLPPNTYIRYGWNEIMDSLNVQSPESFWLVLDYSSVDTSKYSIYIGDVISKRYIMDSKETFNINPNKVELYRFRKE